MRALRPAAVLLSLVVIGGVSLWAGSHLPAQTRTDSLADLRQDLFQVQQQLDRLEGVQRRIEQLQRQQSLMRTDQDSLSDTVRDLVGETLPTVQLQLRELDDRLEDISTPGEEGYVLDLMGNAQRSAEFRAEQVRSTQGKLMIRNLGDDDRIVYVNGSPWRIPADGNFWVLWVPRGRVATHLWPDVKSASNWSPDLWRRGVDGVYRLRLDIEPSADSSPREPAESSSGDAIRTSRFDAHVLPR